MKKTKFIDETDDASAARIAGAIEKLLATEIGKLKCDPNQCAAVHAAVIGLLQGGFFVTIKEWREKSSKDAKDSSDIFESLVRVSFESAQALTKRHGFNVEQTYQSVVTER